MNNINVFVSHYTIDNSPSILNLLEFLSLRFQVTLYVRRVGLRRSDVLNNVHVIEVDNDFIFIKTIMLNTLKSFFSNTSRQHSICIDPHGFFICSLILPFARPTYYSLELYVSDDHFGLHYPWWIRFNERRRINSIRGLIIQSREKDEIFRRDYGLSQEIPTFLLPVTYNGPSAAMKSNYLRTKFGIKPRVRVALHLGGIAEWFSCIELARTFVGLDDWVLVFHGYASPQYLKQLKDTLQREQITNVYINDELYAELEMVNEVIMSCDLGIAWYNDLSIGFRTAGHSSGKIPAYMRFGLPVVAKRYRSTLEAIEEPGAGLCVDKINEIPEALGLIVGNYECYSSRARETYDSCNNFQNYVADLERFIDSCYGEVIC